jgi:hypothetical protein
MRATAEHTASSRYVLTEQGRLDLHTAPRCDCNPRLSGLLIECPKCGTIYGTLREQGPWAAPAWDRKR